MLPNERKKNGCHTLCHQHELVEICLKRESKSLGPACGFQIQSLIFYCFALFTKNYNFDNAKVREQ